MIGELLHQKEGPCFDRKSIWVEPKALAIPLVAMANADGGTLLIGVNDRGEVEGVVGHETRVNELLRVPFDFCKPTIKVDFEQVDCTDRAGQPNKVLVLTVHQSPSVHANQADEVFYRVGDKSKKLSFDERMQLMYDKGDRFYEDTPVAGASPDDLNIEKVAEYTKRIDYSKPPLLFLRENHGFIRSDHGKEQVSAAAILLFGKAPQQFFPRARVRFIRYEGTEEKTGTQMNVIKDVSFEGTILEMVQQAIAFVSTQIKEHTYLGKGGLFVTDSQYPEFVRQEILVNAVAHRDYSIKGTDIQIKMFDDRLTVESPGTLPGLVRLNTMRNVHFSRNPRIAAFLRDYGFVKEFGEGVDRMCAELTGLGMPEPEYRLESFMLQCIVRAMDVGKKGDSSSGSAQTTLPARESSVESSVESSGERLGTTDARILRLFSENPAYTIPDVAEVLKMTPRGVEKRIAGLKKEGRLVRTGSTKKGLWKVIPAVLQN